jgi:hypothetical protein
MDKPPCAHRYASISHRTKAVREREAAQIQRSNTFVAAAVSTLSGWKLRPVSASQRSVFCTRNLQRGRHGLRCAFESCQSILLD